MTRKGTHSWWPPASLAISASGRNGKDDLSEMLAAFHRRHRLGSVRERKGLVDERRDLPLPRELEAGLDLCARVDERADDLPLHPEERDDVEGHHLARVTAADHEPAVFAERVEALLEELAAHVLEDEVDAAAVGETHDLLDDVLCPVVDAVVHAELRGADELLVGARVADDDRAGEMGELDGGGADAAADRVDHHGLPDLEPAAREQHVPRRAEGDLERCGRLVGQLVGDAHELARRTGEPLGVAAGGAEADEARGEAE